MGARTAFAYSSSSSSSASQSSRGHRQREQKAMDKFEHLSLHRPPPPPRSIQFRSKKKHHHLHPFPSFPISHYPRNLFQYNSADGPHFQSLDGAGKLRVKPPKHLKKCHKLHRKLMKAHKLLRSARRDTHLHHHLQSPSPNTGFFSNPCGHHPIPGFCLQEGLNCFQEVRVLHHHHPRGRGKHPYPPYPRPPLIKSEVEEVEVALVSPRAQAEALAEQPVNESGVIDDELAPVVMAP